MLAAKAFEGVVAHEVVLVVPVYELVLKNTCEGSERSDQDQQYRGSSVSTREVAISGFRFPPRSRVMHTDPADWWRHETILRRWA
jgi:hypothetical protein